MQAIITKYLGPTNSRGSRIVAKCWAGKVTVPWDYRLEVRENHEAAAKALIEELVQSYSVPWDIVAAGNMPDGPGYAFIIQ